MWLTVGLYPLNPEKPHMFLISSTGFAKYFRIRHKRLVNIAAATLTIAWLSGLFGIITRAGSATGYLGHKYDEFYGFVYRGLPITS